MPKVCHSSESWNPEVVDFKGTGFPIKNFGNDIFRLLQEPLKDLELVAMNPPLVLKTPAKINWTLYVLDKREDGYHNILSLMHCIDIYDTLAFEHANDIELITNMDIPAEQNLVFKAALMMREYASMKTGARIVLKKQIPLGAGLGGGSSDAACTLSGLNRIWRLGLSVEELKTIGSGLGSDVPFFLNCPLAVAEGRGELLTPFEIDIAYTLLMVKPDVSIPTPWAYSRIDKKGDAELTKSGDKVNNIKLILDVLRRGDVRSLKSLVHNDFEDTVISAYPIIGILKKKLIEAGAIVSLMSGSGSTVFGLFESRDKAVNASRHFLPHWNRVVLTAVNSE
jgi:4-diphosphocytidyl-2-C-methyl-D-erythritol kinase